LWINTTVTPTQEMMEDNDGKIWSASLSLQKSQYIENILYQV